MEARAQLGIAVGNQYPQQQQFTGDAIYIDQSRNETFQLPGALVLPVFYAVLFRIPAPAKT